MPPPPRPLVQFHLKEISLALSLVDIERIFSSQCQTDSTSRLASNQTSFSIPLKLFALFYLSSFYEWQFLVANPMGNVINFHTLSISYTDRGKTSLTRKDSMYFCFQVNQRIEDQIKNAGLKSMLS